MTRFRGAYVFMVACSASGGSGSGDVRHEASPAPDPSAVVIARASKPSGSTRADARGTGPADGARDPAAPGPSSSAAGLPTSGRLAPEVIQRIVRARFRVFRLCYEKALAKDPNIGGRIAVRFVIQRDGSVASAKLEGTDLPDREMVDCVVSSFAGYTFPPPEGGVVTVVYPIMFSPQETPAPDGTDGGTKPSRP